MEYSISNQFDLTGNAPSGVYPALNADGASTSKLLVLCSDESVCESLTESLLPIVEGNKALSATAFNDALDAALHNNGQNIKQCDLALIAFHRAGALVAQMGNSRVLQVRCTADEASKEYDSRDQVLDIYSSKAKVELITDIKPCDYFVACMIEKFNPHKLVRTLGSPTGGDDSQRFASIKKLLSEDLKQDVAIAMCKVDEVKGVNPMLNIKDLNPKWFLIAAVLLVAIGVCVFFSYNGNFFAPSDQDAMVDSTSMNQDSTARDSIVPAVNTGIDTVAPARTDSAMIAKPKRKAEIDTIAASVHSAHTTEATVESHEGSATESHSQEPSTKTSEPEHKTETPQGE